MRFAVFALLVCAPLSLGAGAVSTATVYAQFDYWEDGTIREAQPDIADVAGTTLAVSAIQGGPGVAAALLRIDLAGPIGSAEIVAASLFLHCDAITGSPARQLVVADANAPAWAFASPDPTWNAPGGIVGGSADPIAIAPAALGYVQWDGLGPWASRVRSSPEAEEGLVVYFAEPTAHTATALFASMDAPANRPYMRVDMLLPGGCTAGAHTAVAASLLLAIMVVPLLACLGRKTSKQ